MIIEEDGIYLCVLFFFKILLKKVVNFVKGLYF